VLIRCNLKEDMVEAVQITNEEIAEILDEVADLLAAQEADSFRIMAYRRAAATLRGLPDRVTDILEVGGLEALTALPGIGESLARCIAEIVDTETLALLERLRGQVDPEALFATVGGIGPKLAKTIHERLGIETLEELEAAAHDGRLADLHGFGPRRLRNVAEALAGRLGRRSRRTRAPVQPSSVEDLLQVDREYREKAEAGTLRRIAPRRFNPEGKAWLPILHTERGGRHYTALYSNTARAHELGKTQDWVVIYQDDGRGERQATVVTEHRGPLEGRRVVRGRESECLEFYQGGRRQP
jgi:predicted flap endonuclease-1-like 5' DNA nuclease